MDKEQGGLSPISGYLIFHSLDFNGLNIRTSRKVTLELELSFYLYVKKQ